MEKKSALSTDFFLGGGEQEDGKFVFSHKISLETITDIITQVTGIIYTLW